MTGRPRTPVGTPPLAGRRVLVTRPKDQASELVNRLRALGAEPIVVPLIRIVPPDDPGPLQRAAARAAEFDWIVFTSANAVDAFMRAFLDGTRDIRAFDRAVLCATGSRTAARLAHYGRQADLVPAEFRGEAVVAAILERGAVRGQRVLLPRSEIGRDVIAEELRRAGALVTDVVAYRTIPDEGADGQDGDVQALLDAGRIDIVTFTSASAVRSFVERYGAARAADLLQRAVVGVIGPVTAEAAEQCGIRVDVQPSTYTAAALADALAAYVT